MEVLNDIQPRLKRLHVNASSQAHRVVTEHGWTAIGISTPRHSKVGCPAKRFQVAHIVHVAKVAGRTTGPCAVQPTASPGLVQ